MRIKNLSIMVLSLAALTLLGGKCTPPAVPESPEQTTSSETSAQNEVVSPAPADMTFVVYENRAVNYTLERPDRWYWRHYIANQIGDRAPGVEDYFITDPLPLKPLGEGMPGMIMVEVSSKDVAEYASAVEGLSQSSAMITGESAQRYEGVRDGNKIIEYQFVHGNRTFRARYQAPETSGQEGVLEHLVKSLTFGT